MTDFDVLDALRKRPMRAHELSRAFVCRPEEIYARLVRLEAEGFAQIRDECGRVEDARVRPEWLLTHRGSVFSGAAS